MIPQWKNVQAVYCANSQFSSARRRQQASATSTLNLNTELCRNIVIIVLLFSAEQSNKQTDDKRIYLRVRSGTHGGTYSVSDLHKPNRSDS